MKWCRLFLLFILGVSTSALLAVTPPDFYFTKYTLTELWFLNQHYTEIENNRLIRIEGLYQDHQWKKPYAYQESLKALGLNIRDYNVLQFSIRETGGVNFAFPLVLVWAEKGALPELTNLQKGRKIALYGRFLNLKDSEFAIELHVMETIDKGGRQVQVLLDTRMPPTPTPTITPTPTPGPNLWQKLQKKLKSVQAQGTVTPEAVPNPAP